MFFKDIYIKRIIKLIDQIIEIQITPEKEYVETKEFEYFMNVKNHYSLTAILFLADEKKMELEFLKVIENNLQDKFDGFYNSYKNLKMFVEETFEQDKFFLNKMKINTRVDFVHYCYNLNFYETFSPYTEFKDSKNKLFLDAIFKGTLESIKTIFKEFM